MKIKSKIIITILSLAVLGCIFYIFQYKAEINNKINISDENILKEIVSPQKQEEKIKDKEVATLIVRDKIYSGGINIGDTVYDLMKKLQEQKENNFSFKYKEYPRLGIFVEEINGKRNEIGKYWIYSINNKEAQVGISNYKLKKEDIVKWEQK